MIALYVEGQSTTKKVTCLGAIPIVTVEIEPSGWTRSVSCKSDQGPFCLGYDLLQNAVRLQPASRDSLAILHSGGQKESYSHLALSQSTIGAQLLIFSHLWDLVELKVSNQPRSSSSSFVGRME
jgi:hypothetical protein